MRQTLESLEVVAELAQNILEELEDIHLPHGHSQLAARLIHRAIRIKEESLECVLVLKEKLSKKKAPSSGHDAVRRKRKLWRDAMRRRRARNNAQRRLRNGG